MTLLSFFSLNFLEVLALIVFFFGVPLYIINHVDEYLGKGGLWAVLRLWKQGSITYGWWSLKELGAKNVQLQERKEMGGREIAGAREVHVDSKFWPLITGKPFLVRVTNPWLDLTTNAQGRLHLTRLLQEVGLMQELAVESQPEPVPAGSSRDESHKGSVNLRMTAQIRVSTCTASLETGHLVLSEDIAAVFGNDMFIQAAIGEAHVKAALDNASPKEPWYERNHWPEPAQSTGRPLYPLLVDASSEHMSLRAQGWRTTTGILLQQPIMSHVDFSSSLASLMLAKVHPLLASAVGLDEGERISAALMPLAGHHPAEMWNVRLQPMKMGMDTKGLLKGILNLLKIGNGGGMKRAQRLEAWASQLECDLYRSGLIVSKRLDVLIGSNVDSGKGMHIAMWGRVDAENGDACAMTLGIPAATLSACGLLSDLPADYVFPVKVSGTAQKPVVDWIGAAKELGELLLEHRVSKDLPCLGPFIQRTMTRVASARNKGKPRERVPPPLCPFPWEY